MANGAFRWRVPVPSSSTCLEVWCGLCMALGCLGTSCWGRLLAGVPWLGTSCWEHLSICCVGWEVALLGTCPLLDGDISPVGWGHPALPDSAHKVGLLGGAQGTVGCSCAAEPGGVSEAKPKPKNLMVCFHCPKVLATSLPVTVLLAGRPC